MEIWDRDPDDQEKMQLHSTHLTSEKFGQISIEILPKRNKLSKRSQTTKIRSFPNKSYQKIHCPPINYKTLKVQWEDQREKQIETEN